MTLQTCEQGLLVVHAEVFLAEEGVFKCMNVRDVVMVRSPCLSIVLVLELSDRGISQIGS